MMPGKTVNDVDSKSMFSEITGNEKKAERFGPEVKGGKVVDPGVDQDEDRFQWQSKPLSLNEVECPKVRGQVNRKKGVSF